MSKTRTIVAGVLVAAAVGAAGAAAAQRSQATQQATATFSAATVSRSQSSTCTSADGTYQETNATYAGTASSSDARLNGPFRIRAHSVVNTTTGLGFVQGDFRIDGSTGGAHGDLHATVTGGNLAGALSGDTNGPSGKLLATVAATFSQANGFSSGTIGSGSLTGSGIVFQRGECTRQRAPKPTRSTYVAGFHLSATQGTIPNGKGDGFFTLDVSRDSGGAITGATAVFYVNYRFAGPVTISGLKLTRADNSVPLDSGTGTIVDTDGGGNITKVVSGVSASLTQDLLANPHGYFIQLTTTTGGLRGQLSGFARH